MKVLFVSAEVFSLAKTGGLADVSRALPMALSSRGQDVHILMPGYPQALKALENAGPPLPLPEILGIRAGLIAGTLPGTTIPVSLIHCPELYDRPGGLYQDPEGALWPDNARRFAYLSHVACAIATGEASMGWVPDIIHANDWHTGLVPLLIAERPAPRPRTVFTVHNMAFQGNFPADALDQCRIDSHYFQDGSVEFYGQISYLKAGLTFADQVTTVSPTYAREILTQDFGCGMEGVLQRRGTHFCGILNGIDPGVWDPAHDHDIAAPYSLRDISGKRLCKAALQSETGLPLSPAAPVIGFVSRLTEQKMADIVAEAIPDMVKDGAQFVLVGQGDPVIEARFTDMAARFKNQVSVHIGYSETEAHRLQAGSDILLAPARFEPCGLTQLYGLRYGTLPVVRRTGGLADTVADVETGNPQGHVATGFVFDGQTQAEFSAAVGRALTTYREPLRWRRLQLAAMEQDFSWDASAARYIALYHDITGKPRARRPAAGRKPPDESIRQSTG